MSGAGHLRRLLHSWLMSAHPKNYEGRSKDYEFSQRSMDEHWRAGYHDARRTLRHPEVLQRPDNHEVSLLSTLPRTDVNRSDQRVSNAPTLKDMIQSQ
jgi:hypothetical protein